MNNSLDELLLKIKEKPGMYLARPSLERLSMFINGYIVCMHQINGNYDFEFHPGFQEFIVKKYDIKISVSWAEIINFVSITDERAFYKFFELLDEFLKLKEEEKDN